jgi:hypothetical protein
VPNSLNSLVARTKPRVLRHFSTHRSVEVQVAGSRWGLDLRCHPTSSCLFFQVSLSHLPTIDLTHQRLQLNYSLSNCLPPRYSTYLDLNPPFCYSVLRARLAGLGHTPNLSCGDADWPLDLSAYPSEVPTSQSALYALDITRTLLSWGPSRPRGPPL